MTIDDVLQKLKADIDWRGPGGGKQGHVVIKRDQAELLYKWVTEQIAKESKDENTKGEV